MVRIAELIGIVSLSTRLHIIPDNLTFYFPSLQWIRCLVSLNQLKIAGKAAPLALAIGARLEEFESSQQSLDLYCDVLKMWRTDTKVNASLETLGAWFEPSLSTKALQYTVKLKTRIGKCLCDMGEMEKGALGYRDAYLVSLVVSLHLAWLFHLSSVDTFHHIYKVLRRSRGNFLYLPNFHLLPSSNNYLGPKADD